METTIQLTLPEDFNTLCSIYQIQPEYFIQTFIDKISLPIYYGGANDSDKWSTLFFLQFLESEHEHYEVNDELETKFLTKFNRIVRYNFEPNLVNTGVTLTAGREVMREWLIAVLAERSKYLTDTL